ncbi:MAG TPA: TAXI family TRAP transporter solute-binding subunit [Candidatus Acidoferrum sp.]
MAVNPQGSYSAEVANQYHDLLAKDGIDLELVSSAGAIQSLALLQDAKSGVSIAIIPSGMTNEYKSPELTSLGTLFYEPLWCFSKSKVIRTYEDLAGLNISIGPESSGAHVLSEEFLARVGIVDGGSTKLFSWSAEKAAAALLNGEIDAAILLDTSEAPVVHELLTAKDVTVNSVARADAFIALYPFLNKLTLAAGVTDMKNNRPPNDVLLLATEANLVVRSDLHPAIQYRLLEAASHIHSRAGLFQTAGRFPAAEANDLPLSVHARQFYKTGPPFLQRHLPFWLAVLVQQLLVLLIPIVGVAYPILQFYPQLYNWIQQRRICMLYSELMRIEAGMVSVLSQSDSKGLIECLDQLEHRANQLSLPQPYLPLLYNLKSHIVMVRQQIGNLHHNQDT